MSATLSAIDHTVIAPRIHWRPAEKSETWSLKSLLRYAKVFDLLRNFLLSARTCSRLGLGAARLFLRFCKGLFGTGRFVGGRLRQLDFLRPYKTRTCSTAKLEVIRRTTHSPISRLACCPQQPVSASFRWYLGAPNSSWRRPPRLSSPSQVPNRTRKSADNDRKSDSGSRSLRWHLRCSWDCSWYVQRLFEFDFKKKRPSKNLIFLEHF